ncbi:PREDICTED: zinc finger protein 276, partial [Tinamus guttatus]|uniref:zinc finger protein 276 n=1 Tax=Tinamus guttatus TaxID=94827 RepID=UPI00052EFB13
CKKCHAQFYKCRSVLRTFIQRVNASPTGHAKAKGKYVAFLCSRSFSTLPCGNSLWDSHAANPWDQGFLGPSRSLRSCRSSSAQAQPGADGAASCLADVVLGSAVCALSPRRGPQGAGLAAAVNTPCLFVLNPNPPVHKEGPPRGAAGASGAPPGRAPRLAWLLR